MRIVVTCGPSYEPIDRVRRLTNFSTGTLGVSLANYFVEKGADVLCLKAEGSTCCVPCRAQKTVSFGTNEDLALLLEEAAGKQSVDVVLHAAALCDYRVETVSNLAGEPLISPKFATREGRIQLLLSPAMKILPQLRGWFADALIVGWKYELAGTRAEAFDKAWRQMEECRTDACVLNGSAYGEGFALCHPDKKFERCADGPALAEFLEELIHSRRL